MAPTASTRTALCQWPRKSGATSARLHELTDGRLAGPGGLYNLGNGFGLLTGVSLSVVNAQAGFAGIESAATATFDYFAGNAAALTLTAATLIFFWGGEAYHRAWANGSPPISRLNCRGDVLSAIGALVLGFALISLGQVMLAVTAGALHAFGKFGSAYGWRLPPGWRRTWPDFYRSTVLASRVPAIIAALFKFGSAAADTANGGTLVDPLTPLTLLVCYAFWCSADLLLFLAKPAD